MVKALGGRARGDRRRISFLCLLAAALLCLRPVLRLYAETGPGTVAEITAETAAGTTAGAESETALWTVPEATAGTASEAATGTTSTLSETTDVPSIELYAQSAVLMDADSGRILYGKNMDEIRPMASTTKIMTCILALERADVEDTVEVSAYAASMPDVQLNIRQGEQYRLGDLLHSLMLESHNDSAVAIAEHVGGNVEDFAKLMNEKAASLGCKDTWFITPNGLDAVQAGDETKEGTTEKSHSTTAADLARIMRYCVMESPQKEMFLQITQTQDYSFTDLSGNRSFSCHNHNALLTMFTGALSGKTGFTGKAGYCYIGAASREGKTLVVALLASGWPPHKTYKWSDCRKLLDYGFDNYSLYTLDDSLIDYNRFASIPVRNAQTAQIGDSAVIPLQIIESEGVNKILLKETERVQVNYQIPDALTAPVAQGETVGRITYTLDGEELCSYRLIAPQNVKAIDYPWWLKQVFRKFCFIKVTY